MEKLNIWNKEMGEKYRLVFNINNKYSKSRKCCKCGEGGTYDKHIKKEDLPYNDMFDMTDSPDEWIDRRCKNCDYKWAEFALDTKEK